MLDDSRGGRTGLRWRAGGKMETLTRPKPEDVLKSTGEIIEMSERSSGKYKDPTKEDGSALSVPNQSVGAETEDDVLRKGIESFRIAKREAEKNQEYKKAMHFQSLIDSYEAMLSGIDKAA